MRTMHSKFKKATSTRKGRIIALSILLFIVAAIGSAVVYWNIYRKQIIRNELENAIGKKSGGLYSFSYDSLKLDEVAGNLAISGIKLVYDSNRYNRLRTNNDAPPTLVKITIPLVSVTGVETPRALLSKEISGNKLTIKDPVIDIIYTLEGKDSARNVPTSEVYKQILGEFNLIKLDTVEITGAQITTSNLKTKKKNVELNNTSLVLVHVNIDEKTGNEPGQLLFAKQLFLQSGKISFVSEDRPYRYTIDSISINSVNNTGYVRRFRIDPLLEEKAFVKNLPFQDDRFDFSFNKISLRNIDIRKLLDENIIADSVLISSASLKIYRDLTLPRDKKNRVGKYPHQLLEKLPVSLQVKKMIMNNAFVEYREKSKITGRTGKVSFHGIAADISNLTNNDEAVKANNLMTAAISSRFLNKAPLNVVWRFYLKNPRGRFDIKGTMGTIAAAEVNPVTEPMGPAKLEDGQVKSLSFNFEGNNYGMDGTVKMLYNDLKLALLEQDKGSKEFDKKSLASFVANIVVKNNNPSTKKEEPRVVDVHFERDTNRSIFHLVWKSIFKGIRETVGIKK